MIMRYLLLIAFLGANPSELQPDDVQIGLSMNVVAVKSITVTTTEMAPGAYWVRVKGLTTGGLGAHTFQAEKLVIGPVNVIYDGSIKINP